MNPLVYESDLLVCHHQSTHVTICFVKFCRIDVRDTKKILKMKERQLSVQEMWAHRKENRIGKQHTLNIDHRLITDLLSKYGIPLQISTNNIKQCSTNIQFTIEETTQWCCILFLLTTALLCPFCHVQYTQCVVPSLTQYF